MVVTQSNFLVVISEWEHCLGNSLYGEVTARTKKPPFKRQNSMINYRVPWSLLSFWHCSSRIHSGCHFCSNTHFCTETEKKSSMFSHITCMHKSHPDIPEIHSSLQSKTHTCWLESINKKCNNIQTSAEIVSSAPIYNSHPKIWLPWIWEETHIHLQTARLPQDEPGASTHTNKMKCLKQTLLIYERKCTLGQVIHLLKKLQKSYSTSTPPSVTPLK